MLARRDSPYPRQQAGTGVAGVAFADEAMCHDCHAEEAAAWRRSHHARAMLPAADSSIAGDFDDAVFTDRGITTRFHRDGTRFLVDTEGATGETETFEVRYTFGTEPLQQLLVALPGGRLQALTVAWDTQRRAWFTLQPDERVTPSDPLHWTGRYYRWNDRCAACHSTGLRVGFDPESGEYETTWAAINVGCQACHGPGADHVAWARSNTTAADAVNARDVGLVLDVGTSRDAQLWQCARCHARRSHASADGTAGTWFDDYSLALLREGLYHADGQILDEVYVTGSFLQSRMYRQGVGCSDCHDAHDGRLLHDGDALCTRCHQATPPAQFPTLRARTYDTPAHHHHTPGEAGSRCVDCHMPERTYMQVDGRRDHSLRVPRPDLTEQLGSTDACTGCHTDHAPAWAAAAIDRWYDAPARPPHFGVAIAAARAGAPDATERLLALAADSAQPAIARATALELLSDATSAAARTTIGESLDQADPLIRLAAVEATALLSPEDRLALLAPRLADSLGSIRLAAGRLLAPLTPALTNATDRARLDGALAEYRALQHAQADQPEANHNLGALAAALGDPGTAEASFRAALSLDSAFLPAYASLATLYNGVGRNVEAEALLRSAIARAPEDGELYYALGLLLAELGRMPEAANALTTAADRLPQRPRVHYNRGLALQRLGRYEDAEVALRRAAALAPRDPAYLAALVFLYREAGRRADAIAAARRLVALAPDEDGPRALLRQIEDEHR